MVFCIQNSDYSTRIASLYGSQTSPVDLWMQNSVLIIQNDAFLLLPDLTCRFVRSKQRLASELLVSMGPRPHLSVFACKTACFSTRITSLYGSQTSPVVLCIHNSDIIAPELTSLYGSQTSPVVLCMQNSVIRSRITSLLWVPDFTCRFVHAKQRLLRSRNTSLYWSQTSPMVFCIQNCDFSTRICKSLWVPALICGFCMQNSDFWIRITSLYGSQTSPVDLWM